MYGREELEVLKTLGDELNTSLVDCESTEVWLDNGTELIPKEQADKVMDAMEARIKELELYDYRRLPSVYTESFKNIRGGVAYEFEKLKARIKELESQCTQYQSELMNRNPALNTDISKMETTTTKWISANDRLPEEQIDVLFIEEDGCVHIGEMWKAKNEVYWFGRGEPCCNYVTHWMPIPTPPTTEKM